MLLKDRSNSSQIIITFSMNSYRFVKQTPEFHNELYYVFLAADQQSNPYFAKIFNIPKLQQYGLDEALQYNQEVLSDLQGVAFSQNLNKIVGSIPNDGMFTFITQPYEITLQQYMRKHVITQNEALRIFDNVLKATYATYARGYWHKCIRPQHFVKIGDLWKLDSLVYSEDISKCKNIQSEYTWNPRYQPPQAYERNVHNFGDDQFLPIVVWNLGSLLLDLFFSVHKLSNYELLKCFKGKKFTLQDIKVKKTDLFSKKLKDILAYMLHYDPKSRMKLQEVFSNEFLSRQVALLFKQKHKNSLAGAPIKIFTGGRSALSSALLSKQERQKGSKILPINEMIKSTINTVEPTTSTVKQQRLIKSMYEVETDEDSGGKASMRSIFDRFLGKKSNQNNQKHHRIFPSSIEQLFKNKELESIIKNYKTISDKSELLTITGEKFNEVDYKEYQKQINLISKYSVYIMSYLNIKELIQDMNSNHNFLNIDQPLFNSFANSWQYRAFIEIINRKLAQKDQAVQQIKQQIDSLGKNQRKIIDQAQIKTFVSIDKKTATFQDIKTCYRKILKISYDIVTKAYNQNSSNQKLARLAMYIVYCLAIDKLYLPSMIETNFLPYFQWINQQPSPYIPIEKLQKYVEEASIKRLVFHAKVVLQRFFKL